MDVSFFERDVHFSFWRHMSTPGWDSSRPKVQNYKYLRIKGDKRLRELATGWSDGQVDHRWTFDDSTFKVVTKAPVSVGICYRRISGSGRFASWSVDDVKIRQKGCEK